MKRTKEFAIVKDCNGEVCTKITASSERFALRKYCACLLSSGYYDIIVEEDGRPRLVSSFGSCYRADPVPTNP